MPAWRMTPRFARTFCPAPLRGRVLRDTPQWRHLRSPARVRHGETVFAHARTRSCQRERRRRNFLRPIRVMRRRDSFHAAFRYPNTRAFAA
jgi:hypothetical protein